MRPTPAIFASAFHPHVGGVEELVSQLATEQRRRGDGTLVITNRYPKDLPAREAVGAVEVMRESFRVPGLTWRHVGGFLAHSRSTARRIQEELSRRGTGLVHVQCVSNNGYYALRAAEALDLPLVVTMQGELTMDADRVYERSAHLRHTWRRLLDRAAVITACSDYSLKEAEQVYGTAFGDRAHVIHNGIRLEEYTDLAAERRDRPYVLGLGRMVHQKGYDLLIDAFVSLAEAIPHDLLLAGDGASRARLEAQAAAAGIGDRVHFLGTVNHSRALSLFAGADAFVLASRHEPQGIVLLEAMAAGTAVVAARVGGVPELVNDQDNGMLFEGGSSASLGRVLQEVLANRALRTRIIENGRRDASKFDWARITDHYDAAYLQATRSPA